MSVDLNQLYSSLSSINREFGSFSKILSENSRSSNAVDQAFKATTNSASLQKAAQQALANSITNAATSLTSFAKSMANASGSFEPLTSIITSVTGGIGSLMGKFPIIGGALEGIVKGGGQVAVAMIQQFDRTYGIFEKLSDVGIVTTFNDLRRSSQMMNLSIADTQVVMTKHSKNMALWGSSAVDGRKQFEQVAYATTSAKLDFQKLGITSQDFTDMQSSYVNQQMRLSLGQKQTTQKMADSSLTYMKELDAMAKLTGSSRKSIQAERDSRLIDARYRASMSELPEKIRNNIDSLLDATVMEFGKGTEQGLRDVISSDGAATTEAGKAFTVLMESAGMSVADTVMQLKTGSMQMPELLDKIRITGKDATGRVTELIKATGDSTMLGKLFVEASNGGIKAGVNTRKTLEDIAAEQDKTIKDTKSQNATLASTKQNMENFQKTLEQLSTESELATRLLDFMSEGLKDATNKVAGWAGVDLDPLKTAEKNLKDAEQRLAIATTDVDSNQPNTMARRARISSTQLQYMISPIGGDKEALEQNIKDAERAVTEAQRSLNDKRANFTSSSGRSSSTPSPIATPVAPNPSSTPSAPSAPSVLVIPNPSPNAQPATATGNAGPVGNPAGGVVARPLPTGTNQPRINPWTELTSEIMIKFNSLDSTLGQLAERQRRAALSN